MFINRIDRQTPRPGKKTRIPGKSKDSEAENAVFEIDVVQISSGEEANQKSPQQKPKNQEKGGGADDSSSLDITA